MANFTAYTSPPSIKISPELTKIVTLGEYSMANGTTAPKVNSWHIDYDTCTNLTIPFPMEIIRDPTNTYFDLGDFFWYFRDEPAVPDPVETAFFLSHDSVTVLSFERDI